MEQRRKQQQVQQRQRFCRTHLILGVDLGQGITCKQPGHHLRMAIFGRCKQGRAPALQARRGRVDEHVPVRWNSRSCHVLCGNTRTYAQAQAQLRRGRMPKSLLFQA